MANIHPLSDVQSSHIGEHTNVWQFCVILHGAVIGDHCNICAHVLIENDVRIGDNVTIKSGVQIWDGVTLEDNVFIGPNVTFTNDKYPISKNVHYEKLRTTIQYGASIGANATILPGVTIGAGAIIGAGSVVTKDIPNNTIWYGNPIQQHGYVLEDGTICKTNKCIDNQCFMRGGVNNFFCSLPKQRRSA